jgi:hypothetical protein
MDTGGKPAAEILAYLAGLVEMGFSVYNIFK